MKTARKPVKAVTTRSASRKQLSAYTNRSKRRFQHAVGLKKIYVLVSQTTASASEMVINGLRGLDIEVNLIGQTTNGKNVGMEGVMRSFYNHEFLLYPVTFYVENAKGFRDYSTGFVPDVEIDDSAIYPGSSVRWKISSAILRWCGSRAARSRNSRLRR